MESSLYGHFHRCSGILGNLYRSIAENHNIIKFLANLGRK